MANDTSEHFLFSFLQSALPSLGLDDEIYGPYLLGLFPQDESQMLAEIDEEELNNVLDLLQGSSQTHACEKEAFAALKAELLKKNETYWCEYRKKAEQLKKDAKQQEEEKKKQEIEESELVKRAIEEKKRALRKDSEEEFVKLRVIQQYAYDDSIQYDSNGDPIDTKHVNTGQGEEVTDTVNLNRVSSTNVAKEHQSIAKNSSEKSKKAAREETARQNTMRMQAKEERRKRAAKGERRR
jgi:hypothetical protein